MVESEQIARLLEAIGAEAARNAEAPVTLVSVTFDWMTPPQDGVATEAHVDITRATRTMVFSTAQLRAGDRLVLAATAVHRIGA